MKPLPYARLRELAGEIALPAVLVDLDAFDRNVGRLTSIARQAQKTIRPATKSVRVPWLLHRISELSGEVVQGWMCYHINEARFLADQGLDNFLIGYPHSDLRDLRTAAQLAERGTKICLMVDSEDHIQRIAEFWGGDVPVRVCIDVDASLRKYGQHFGVQRSPVRSIEQLRSLVTTIQSSDAVQLVGAMTYEALVAGMGDIGCGLLDYPLRYLKKLNVRWLRPFRAELRSAMEEMGVALEFFNGGGSGSMVSSCEDPSLTEVTAGSGFLQSHLFDRYVANQNEPAIYFALPVARVPQPDRITCFSGGYIASGWPATDRLPVVSQPAGLHVDSREGFGEVQTPFHVPHELQGQLRIGDPVFLRPAKSGEIAERFAEYHLFREHGIVETVKTYRGLGQCFP